MESIRSRLLAHRNRASQLRQAAGAPRHFATIDAPLYNNLIDTLVQAGRPIPGGHSATAALPVAATVHPVAATVFPFAATVLPVAATVPTAVANATSASSDINGASDPVLAMLARRFAAEREDYAYIETCAYGSGYMDLLLVNRIQVVCQVLGIRPERPSETVQIENMQVSYGHIKLFLNTKAYIKNTFTLAIKASRVHLYLQAQERGAMSVDESVLYRQLNCMLSNTPIAEGNQDPVAAQASQMSRVKLGSLVGVFLVRRGG